MPVILFVGNLPEETTRRLMAVSFIASEWSGGNLGSFTRKECYCGRSVHHRPAQFGIDNHVPSDHV